MNALAEKYEALAKDYEDAPRDVSAALYAARLREAAKALKALPPEAADTISRLRKALADCKAFVVGERVPNWDGDAMTYLTRGKIADICDIALAHPNHPRDLHLTIERRGPQRDTPE